MGMLLLNGSTDLNPRELFANGEQGLWLDPSDMTAGKAGWRRNLLTYSEQMDNSYWTKSAIRAFGSGSTADAIAAPDGISTADLMVEDSTNDTHQIIRASITTLPSTTYTFSVYVKAKERTRFYIGFEQTGQHNRNSSFNLSSATSNPTAGTTSTITSVGNGWYRCSVSGDTTASGTSSTVVLRLQNDSSQNVYVGDNTSGIYIWGAQLELGSSASTYQPITDFSTEFKAAFPTHTLYQDSNGVTPCTAAGDPVGLILDQSRGGLSQIGADLVTNGTFAADTDWTKGANWTIGSGVATKTGGAANNLTQTIGSTAAAWYRISLDVTRSAGTLTVSLGTSGTTYAITATGSYTFFILAGSGTQTLTLAGDSSFAGTVDNVVVRNVPGNHAYQTTSASRPTLARIPVSGRRNLLTRTEEFDNAAWWQAGVTVSANAGTDPLGTVLADRLVETAANSEHRIQNSTTLSVTSGTVYTASIYAKAGEVTIVRVGFDDQVKLPGRAFFNLSLGTVSFTEAGSATITAVGNGWYRCTITGTCGTSHSSRLEINLVQSGTTAIYTGNTSNGLLLWGAQLETGSSPSNYQKVVATTDVTESGFPDLYHLVFDGSDDSLVTNSVDFTATDEMTVIAGVRKLSDAAANVMLEFTPTINSNNGSFAIYGGLNSTASGSYWSALSRGTSTAAANSPQSFAAPVTSVVCGSFDISSDTCVLRVNGSQSGTDSTDQGTGNYNNAALYIGRRGGSSLPFNGHLYQLIIRGKTTPTGKLLEAERFVGRKTGVSF